MQETIKTIEKQTETPVASTTQVGAASTASGSAETTPTKRRFFQTPRFQDLLEKEGLSATQASAILNLVQETVEESQRNIFLRIVSKQEHSTLLEEQKNELESVRSTIKSTETRNFNAAKADLERVRDSLKRLASDGPSNITNLGANVKLDINLEKGRLKEELSNMEKRVHTNETKIDGNVVQLKTRIKQVDKELTETIRSFIGGAVVIFVAWKILDASAVRIIAKRDDAKVEEVEPDKFDIIANQEALEWVAEKSDK